MNNTPTIDALIEYLFNMVADGFAAETDRYFIYNHIRENGQIAIKDKKIITCSAEVNDDRLHKP